MNIIFALIPLALLLLAAAFWAFFWAVRSGQFDDLETPGTLVLFDGESAPARPASARAPQVDVVDGPRRDAPRSAAATAATGGAS